MTDSDKPKTNETSKTAAIEATDLVKLYGKRRAIDRVSFRAESGSILGLLGPNGAGKTTTMRVLTGYTPATSGAASIEGLDIAKQSLAARSRLGYLPENAPLYQDMRVEDYLQFMAGIKRIAKRDRKESIDRAMEECSLTDVRHQMISSISRGYRQRVGLAQAVLGDPAVLILDEPTVGLDPRQIAEIRSLIKSMAGKRTTLLSTHILAEVSMICDQVLVLDRGRVVAEGSPTNLVSTLGGSRKIAMTIRGKKKLAQEVIEKSSEVAKVKLERESDGECTFHLTPAGDTDCRAAAVRAVVDAGLDVLEITTLGGSLEDVFLQVISASPQDESVAEVGA